MRPNGPTATPWAGAEIIVLFCGYTQTQFTQRPSDRITTTTALDGSWFVDLWTNALGDYQSYYLFRFPHTQNLRVVLPNGLPTENEFSGLLLNSTPLSAPEYAGLLQLVEDYLGGATLGTADQVALNPGITGLGGTAQSAIAQLNTQLNTLPTKLVELDDVAPSGLPIGGIPTYQGGGIFSVTDQFIDGGNF